MPRPSVVFMVLAAATIVVSTGCSSGPRLEGTYALTHRELADGTVQRPPAIVGLMTYTDGYRNFNIAWENPTGPRTSIGSITRYELTQDAYSERNLYYLIMNDPAGQPGPTYDLSGSTGSSPVTRDGDRMSFQFPLFGEPAATFMPGGFVATRPGAFMDHWKKVE